MTVSVKLGRKMGVSRIFWSKNLKPVVSLKPQHSFFETLILVIFDLIFAMKPPKFLKNLKISLKKKKICETLDGFNEIHEMVSRVSKKRPFFKNTLVYREKIRPMWSNFVAIY